MPEPNSTEQFKEWEIEGEPSFKVRASGLDNKMTTAAQAVNRLLHVVEAPPGYASACASTGMHATWMRVHMQACSGSRM